MSPLLLVPLSLPVGGACLAWWLASSAGLSAGSTVVWATFGAWFGESVRRRIAREPVRQELPPAPSCLGGGPPQHVVDYVGVGVDAESGHRYTSWRCTCGRRYRVYQRSKTELDVIEVV